MFTTFILISFADTFWTYFQVIVHVLIQINIK